MKPVCILQASKLSQQISTGREFLKCLRDLPHELQKEQRPSEPSRLVLPQIKMRREPEATHAGDSLSGIAGSPGGPVLAVAGLELWDKCNTGRSRSHAEAGVVVERLREIVTTTEERNAMCFTIFHVCCVLQFTARCCNAHASHLADRAVSEHHQVLGCALGCFCDYVMKRQWHDNGSRGILSPRHSYSFPQSRRYVSSVNLRYSYWERAFSVISSNSRTRLMAAKQSLGACERLFLADFVTIPVPCSRHKRSFWMYLTCCQVPSGVLRRFLDRCPCMHIPAGL
jgi:hypothetical protein